MRGFANIGVWAAVLSLPLVAGLVTAAADEPSGSADAFQEPLREGSAHAAQIRQSVTAVRGQLEGARSARDVVKVLCLDDKLNQVDVASRSATDRVEAMKLAAQDNNGRAVNHELTMLKVLRDRSQSVVSAANHCVGEEAGFAGDTQVSVKVDPTLPDVGVGTQYGTTLLVRTGSSGQEIIPVGGTPYLAPPVVSSPVD